MHTRPHARTHAHIHTFVCYARWHSCFLTFHRHTQTVTISEANVWFHTHTHTHTQTSLCDRHWLDQAAPSGKKTDYKNNNQQSKGNSFPILKLHSPDHREIYKLETLRWLCEISTRWQLHLVENMWRQCGQFQATFVRSELTDPWKGRLENWWISKQYANLRNTTPSGG